VLTRLQTEYPDDLRVAYRHFPLMSIHDKAALATQAAEAAGIQGKFWEMHDLLFANQSGWSGMAVADFQAWLMEKAAELELDIDQFESDLNSPALAELAKNAWTEGGQMGLPGTPFLVINGNGYNGQISYGNISAIIKLILLEKRQFDVCPPIEIDPSKQYFANLETEKGTIVLELFPIEAPLAVNNFVFLARQGWYNDITFHRVISGFVAQTGDPSGTGYGSPGYAFDNEISPDLTYAEAGMVGMANAGPGSNGSQFFITMAPAEQLNGGYTIFGRVLEGMEIVESLTERDPSQNLGLPPGDQLIQVTIIEK
jgi:cyclophilin family peptidyl-prolyl cis-trans isomerase